MSQCRFWCIHTEDMQKSVPVSSGTIESICHSAFPLLGPNTCHPQIKGGNGSLGSQLQRSQFTISWLQSRSIMAERHVGAKRNGSGTRHTAYVLCFISKVSSPNLMCLKDDRIMGHYSHGWPYVLMSLVAECTVWWWILIGFSWERTDFCTAELGIEYRALILSYIYFK